MAKKRRRTERNRASRSPTTRNSDATNVEQEALRDKAPSPLASILVILVVLLVSIASAATAAVVVDDLLTIMAVFIFSLLILAIVVPYLGLSTGLLTEVVWFKTYVLVLKRVPGLNSVLDVLLELSKRK